ncbi:resolvase [Streptomyces sp. NPDC002491]
MHAGHLGGQSIAGLARDHHVSRGATRTAVADLVPEHTDDHQDTQHRRPRSPSTRRARSPAYRRPAVHRQLLARCQPLDGAQGVPAVPAQRKARREYENRVSTVILHTAELEPPNGTPSTRA